MTNTSGFTQPKLSSMLIENDNFINPNVSINKNKTSITHGWKPHSVFLKRYMTREAEVYNNLKHIKRN